MATEEERRRRWRETSSYWGTVCAETRHRDKHFSPSASRNVEPITARLAERIPKQGCALEVASGTGEHIVAYARRFPGVTWIPSDPHPAARSSIMAWIAESGLSNIRAPTDLDVTAADWHKSVDSRLDVLVASNLLHIAPWSACEGLFEGGSRLLSSGSLLLLYGCFKRGGRHLSAENADFDRSLRYRDPNWGVRDLGDVVSAANQYRLGLVEVIDMPANNLLLVLTPTLKKS